MSVTCYYGLPGCGKTTVLAALAQQELQKIRLGRSDYSAVLTNFYCRGAGVFDPLSLEKVLYRRCLILIDEITLVWDSRSFKTFPVWVKDFFTLHRHLGCSVVYATQYYQNVDKRIRDVTDTTMRVRKWVTPLGNYHVTTREKVDIKYPEETGEIIVGFRKPTMLALLTTAKFYRGVSWYGYFDTHEVPNDGRVLYDSGRRHI